MQKLYRSVAAILVTVCGLTNSALADSESAPVSAKAGSALFEKVRITRLDQPLAELGRRLFFDENLSEPVGTACASCHDPARGFSGDNGSGTGVPAGSRPGKLGFRNSPGLTYLSRVPALGMTTNEDGDQVRAGGLFWDGRADSLEEQAAAPLFTEHEMNIGTPEVLSQRVSQSDYAELVTRVFGEDGLGPTRIMETVTTALGAFQRSAVFAPFSSKFDAVVRGQAQFTDLEERGLTLFTIAQKGNCHSCHAVDIDSEDPRDSLFSNFQYHALGVPRNRELPATQVADYYDLGLCEPLRERSVPDADRYCGMFRVPSLRNVALTAPYMHNGQLKTLRDAVAFYASRDTNPELWYPGDVKDPQQKFDDLPAALRVNVDRKLRPYHRKPGKRPALKDREVDAIVAFLHTLTDGYTPAQKSSQAQPADGKPAR